MKDESRGLLPSASAVPRYAACPGSYLLSVGDEGFRTREMIAWAESGDRIHELLSKDWTQGAISTIELTSLNDEEREVFLNCISQTKSALVVADLGGDGLRIESERRLWLTDDGTPAGKRLLSGKSDFAAIDQNKRIGLVIDYKTGRGEQDDVDESHQIRTLIVLNAQENGYIEEWYGGICQPLISNKIQLVKYTRADVETARNQLIRLVAQITTPGAPTTAGVHCKFCPAILKCQSARAMLQAFGLMEATTSDGQALSEYLLLAKAAKPVIKRIEDHARALLEKDTTAVPGWQIGKGSSTRKVTNTLQCFQLVTEAGLLDRDTFLNDVAGVSVGDLEKAVAVFKGVPKKQATELVNATCLPVIEFGQKAGSLEQV